ncbi:MAG: hypothetical protein C6W59_01175 [Paenibacillaceae bacterium]|jgi:hypothetical protein|nr:MAG: hypothetical protein C6W59_01175 [Paenibacillaceae bacterium]
MVTLTKKLREDLWEAADRENRTILMKVTRINAAPSLGENRPYVIPDIRRYDEELGQEVYVVEGDLIRPLDVEDP